MGTRDRRNLPTDIAEYLTRLRTRCQLRAVVLFGSRARGDAVRWSDYDLFVIADDLPPNFRQRLAFLWDGKPDGVDVLGFTPTEARQSIHRGLVLDVALEGRPLYGNMRWLRTAAQAYVRQNDLVKTTWGYCRRQNATNQT